MVYSTDSDRNKKCPRCRHLVSECSCPKSESFEIDEIIALLRIEKSGRGGKMVTVIDRLPQNEIFLKSLSKRLKSKCGAGGTYTMGEDYGTVEIQGDKRELLRRLLHEEGMRVKG